LLDNQVQHRSGSNAGNNNQTQHRLKLRHIVHVGEGGARNHVMGYALTSLALGNGLPERTLKLPPRPKTIWV
jgi:hypothetical protein